MGDIYRSAHRVVVWLGTENVPFRRRGLLDTIRCATLDPNTNSNDNQLALRECMQQLARNTYWTRAWVLQEFVLGAQIELKLGCGSLQEDIFRQFWSCTNCVRIEPANDLAGEDATRMR